MAYEQKDMSFSAFRNKDKRSETSPEFSGTAIIGGKAYFIDVWKNKVRSGENAGDWMLSGRLKEKTGGRGGASSDRGAGGRGESMRGSSMQRESSGRMNDIIDDDIPF